MVVTLSPFAKVCLFRRMGMIVESRFIVLFAAGLSQYQIFTTQLS